MGRRTRVTRAWKTSAALIGVFAAVSLFSAQDGAPEIAFQEEHIEVFVRGSSIRVDGLYTFANPDESPRPLALYYPIAIDSLHPRQDFVLVRSAGRVVDWKQRENGVVFGVVVPARSELAVEVIYEQSCLDASGCYILTSTAAWEAPLERARFEIHVPDSIELDWMSYEAETVERGEGERIHAFARTDFMPEKDLCFRWRLRRDR